MSRRLFQSISRTDVEVSGASSDAVILWEKESDWGWERERQQAPSFDGIILTQSSGLGVPCMYTCVCIYEHYVQRICVSLMQNKRLYS